MTTPAGIPSTYASLPQEPHSSRVWETQASFSKPGSPVAQARSAETGSSSQYTHWRHGRGRSSSVSRVRLTRRRDMSGSLSVADCALSAFGAERLSKHGPDHML